MHFLPLVHSPSLSLPSFLTLFPLVLLLSLSLLVFDLALSPSSLARSNPLLSSSATTVSFCSSCPLCTEIRVQPRVHARIVLTQTDSTHARTRVRMHACTHARTHARMLAHTRGKVSNLAVGRPAGDGCWMLAPPRLPTLQSDDQVRGVAGRSGEEGSIDIGREVSVLFSRGYR